MSLEVPMSSAPSELSLHEVVRAGAGAGKTTELVSRILSRVEDFRKAHGRFPLIVATTFTRKATQELRERLILAAQQKQDLELLNYVSQKSQLHISTIHGVLSLFLRRYGHLAQLDAGFDLLSEEDSLQWARRQLKGMLSETPLLHELLERFGFQQLSGLFVEYCRARLLCPDLRPLSRQEIEGQTWEYFNSFSSRLAEAAARVEEETESPKFKDYAQGLRRISESLAQPLSPEYWSGVEDSLGQLIRRPPGSKKNPGLSEDTKAHLDELLKDFKAEWGHEGLQPQWFSHFAEGFIQFETVAKEFFEKWIEFKKETGRFDMTDLELMSLEVVRREPELARAFASEWDYWLVDEYQDTSPIQVELIQKLMGSSPSFVVGDPQQSIYLFRGAQSRVFRERESWVAEQRGLLRRKETNYRSRAELLEFFNEFFTSLDSQFMTMEAAQKEWDPQTLVATFAKASELEEESLAVAQFILDKVHEQGVPWDHFCILARTNKTLTELAQKLGAFGIPTQVHAASGFGGRREIQDILALLKFLLQPQDNKNLMVLLRSPWLRIKDQDLVSWLSSANHSSSPRTSHWEKLCSHPEAAQQEVLIYLQKVLKRVEREPISTLLQELVMQLGLVDFSHHQDFSGRREANIWKLLTWLKDLERQPGLNYRSWIEQIEREESSAQGDEAKDAVAVSEPNCVNLMTVHASKGLQFEYVLLPRCHEALRNGQAKDFYLEEDQGLWSLPLLLGEHSERKVCVAGRKELLSRREQEVEELKRLLYVALTRAKSSVFLSWTGEPKKDSWASLWNWPTDLVGTRQRPRFSYEVVTGPWKPEVQKRVMEEKMGVRPKIIDLSAGPEKALLRRSVSSVLRDQEGQKGEGNASSPLRLQDRLQRAHQGILLHRLFELMNTSPQPGLQSLIEDWFGDSAREVRKAVDFVLQLDQPPMRELIQEGHVEWGFHWRRATDILEGQIDLWGEIEGQCWVVDYKSGSPEFVEKAFAQLSIYAQALRAQGVSSPIQMAVIFPLHQKVSLRIFSPN